MLSNTNPTRMELLKLKKKLIMARKGHRLLKDKQDELLRKMLEIMDKVKNHRQKMTKEYFKILGLYSVSKNINPEIFTSDISTENKIKISAKYKNLMSVIVPDYFIENYNKLSIYKGKTEAISQKYLTNIFYEFLPGLFELIGLQKQIELIAIELEKTRRRVNALEYILIPDIIETIKYINLKLSETERGNIIRLLKVKEMILLTK